MSFFAALIYWVIVVLWATVLATIAYLYIRSPRAFGMARLLLAVLAIDAGRNVFENSYFGLYIGSEYGLLPSRIAAVLGQPDFLVLPNILNVCAGCVVLGLLLLRWLPLAMREPGLAGQHASNPETLETLDCLTGLYNRHHFESLLRVELARSQRYMRPLSVLMIDIDHFKPVNDRFGHFVGDRVLKAIAAVCRAATRDADVIGRVGGEEFAITLPETTDAAALQFAERLREQVRTRAPTVEGEELAVTVSIGIAGANLNISGSEALLRRADEALCEARRSGGDRAIVWRPPVFVTEAAE